MCTSEEKLKIYLFDQNSDRLKDKISRLLTERYFVEIPEFVIHMYPCKILSIITVIGPYGTKTLNLEIKYDDKTSKSGYDLYKKILMNIGDILR